MFIVDSGEKPPVFRELLRRGEKLMKLFDIALPLPLRSIRFFFIVFHFSASTFRFRSPFRAASSHFTPAQAELSETLAPICAWLSSQTIRLIQRLALQAA